MGYVAGIGRGATGFTTRSDLGSVQDGPTDEMIEAAVKRREAASDPSKYVQQQIVRQQQQQQQGEEADSGRYQDADDERGLFAGLPYDEDDEEADKIYKAVDEKLAQRRRRQREAQEKKQEDLVRAEGTKIQRNFAEAKRALANVTDEEWTALPEVGDLTKRKRRKEPRRERFYAVSDTFLMSAQKQTQYETIVRDDDDSGGTKTNFEAIGAARDKMLSIKLDQISSDGNLGTNSTIDPKGYLTELNSMVPRSGAGVGDIKRARLLLQSVTSTNPKHAPGWIAAARIEELAGKMGQARNLIAQGCEQCPRSEDVWLENIRLNDADTARVIVAEAVKRLPKSLEIWMQALKLEPETNRKRRVLRRALEMLPKSVQLWKEAVNLESDHEDARLLLARAVELLPESVELWLALARLETYENAKSVLNKARKAIKTSHEIWIAAARLEEQHQQTESVQTGTVQVDGQQQVDGSNVKAQHFDGNRVDTIVSRGVHELEKLGAALQRDNWIEEAEKCEKEGALLTAQALIKATLGQGLNPEDERQTWTDDVEGLIERGSVECARAALAYALRTYSDDYSLWRKAIDIEKSHGSVETLEQVLERAVAAMPTEENLWLIYAREKWRAGDVEQARAILSRAFEQNPNQEEIWLAAVKIEFESREYERARILLRTAREQANTERVWSKSVLLERQLHDNKAALALVDEALHRFPDFDKLWMAKGQIFESEGDVAKARETFIQGTKKCPKSEPLWILLSKNEQCAGAMIRCRNVLERARIANPKQPLLWHTAIEIEETISKSQARALVAKAVQECPTSGILWSDLISMESRTQQRPRAIDALRKTDSDPYLLTTIARIFWTERKLPKTRDWFLKAIAANRDIGDTWAWFYLFLQEHGTEDEVNQLKTQLDAADPRHGIIWPQVAKDIENCHKSRTEILQLVAKKLEQASLPDANGGKKTVH